MYICNLVAKKYINLPYIYLSSSDLLSSDLKINLKKKICKLKVDVKCQMLYMYMNCMVLKFWYFFKILCSE